MACVWMAAFGGGWATSVLAEDSYHCVRVENRSDYPSFNFHLLGQDQDGRYVDIQVPASHEACGQDMLGDYRLAATRQYQEQRLGLAFSDGRMQSDEAWWLDEKHAVYALWSDLEFHFTADDHDGADQLIHIDMLEKTDMDAHVVDVAKIELGQTFETNTQTSRLKKVVPLAVMLVVGIGCVSGVYMIATKIAK